MTNEEQIKKLILNFINIANKGWIEGKFNGIGNVGLTFEDELGKKYDSAFFPDYYGIEIKCTTRFSNYPLSLFKIVFDGPSFNETDRIAQMYGWKNKDFKDKNVLYAFLNANTYSKIKSGYYMKFKLDEDKQLISLLIKNKNNELIDNSSYIFLKSVLDRMNYKLSLLAVVYASKKVIDNITYFRYYKINIYEYKGDDVFTHLLNNGTIKIDLVSRINNSGFRKGKYRNENLVFKINKQDILKLFNLVYSYDIDNK